MSDWHDPSECGKYARLRSQIITRRDELWEGMYSLDASRTKVSRRYADNILELQRQRSAHQQANQQTKPQQEWDLSNKLQVRVGLGQDRLDDDDDEYGERLEQLSSFDDHHPPSDPIERIEREISMEEARFDTHWKLISSEMLEVKAKIELLEDILREDYDGNYAKEEEEEESEAVPHSCDGSSLCAGRGELYEAEEEEEDEDEGRVGGEEVFIEPIDSDTDPIGSEVSTLTLDSEGEDFAKAPSSEGQVSIGALWELFTPTLDLGGEAFIEALDSDGEDFAEALGPKGGVSPIP